MATREAAPRAPPLVSILLFSAAGIAYEVLLMRLFSIVHWHHFAYMMVSVALLGFAASGTFIAILRAQLLDAYRSSFLINGLAFAVSTVVCFLLAQRVPFNTLEVLWDPAQWVWLPVVYFLLALPFFFLANLIALSLTRYEGRMGNVYGADLFGAGLGAGVVLISLYVLHADTVLKAVASLALGAFAVAVYETKAHRGPLWLVVSAVIAGALWLLPGNVTTPAMTPYKGLPQTLLIPGTSVVHESSSPMGLISVVASPEVPFRYAPGMSLNSAAEVPEQLGVFTDGDGFSALTRYAGGLDGLAYLDALTSSLPYRLLSEPRVLIIGAEGDPILQSVSGGARAVDVVEINPGRVELLTEVYAEHFGWRHLETRVDVHIGDARAWVSGSKRYDLVVFPLVESSSAAGAGVHGLMEDFLFTREAWTLYFRSLTEQGMVAISRWVKLPPRDIPKLVITVAELLEEAGLNRPERHIAIIRGWNTATFLLTRAPLDESRIERIKAFAAERSFDVVHYPGITPAETNRYNVLDTAYYADAVSTLLGPERERYASEYPFAIDAATDDRPYFFQFFKWASLATVLALRDVGGFAYFEWGYPILIMTLGQAVLAGIILIIAPFLLGAERRRVIARSGWWPVAYFALLGFAFMFIEMAFIQKLTLFLSHPIHAAAAVLAGFLVFAGAGSQVAAGQLQKRGSGAIILQAGIAVAVLAVGYILLLPGLFHLCIGWPIAAKLVVTFTVVAPLAFAMGMPLPMGLELLSSDHPAAVPWAWCINGSASVCGAVLGTVAAVHWGFTAVVAVASVGYIIAAVAAGMRWRRRA